MQNGHKSLALILSACLVAGLGAGFATWSAHTPNTGNRIQVGQAVTTSLSGTMSGTVYPGTTVSQEYEVTAENAGPDQEFTLEIFDITDGTADSGGTQFEIAAAIDEDPKSGFADLAETDALLEHVKAGARIHVVIRLKEDAPVTVAGATLTFSLKLHEAA